MDARAHASPKYLLGYPGASARVGALARPAGGAGAARHRRRRAPAPAGAYAGSSAGARHAKSIKFQREEGSWAYAAPPTPWGLSRCFFGRTFGPLGGSFGGLFWAFGVLLGPPGVFSGPRQGSKFLFGAPVWAPSWKRIGGLLGRLGGLLSPLGTSGCRLGGLLRPSWGPSWGVMGPSAPP